jgi:hypothetical protein
MIEDNRGQVDANGRCLEGDARTITGVFSERLDAETTVSALTGIGIAAEWYFDEPFAALDAGELDELCECAAPEDFLVIDFEPDRGGPRREIVRLLTFDLVFGWNYFDKGRFLVTCQSEQSAMLLLDKITSSPIDFEITCYLIRDFRDLYR